MSFCDFRYGPDLSRCTAHIGARSFGPTPWVDYKFALQIAVFFNIITGQEQLEVGSWNMRWKERPIEDMEQGWLLRLS